jgi:transcriptional regulator with XRE-family HTH domain
MGATMPPRKTGKPLPEVVAFGARVRKLRLAREWTQERLAEASDMNAVQISHIERGANEAKLMTVIRLARAFGMTASELLKSIR